MKIPGLDGLDEMMTDLKVRGDRMQATLDEIVGLLVKIEQNTRPRAQAVWAGPAVVGGTVGGYASGGVIKPQIINDTKD